MALAVIQHLTVALAVLVAALVVTLLVLVLVVLPHLLLAWEMLAALHHQPHTTLAEAVVRVAQLRLRLAAQEHQTQLLVARSATLVAVAAQLTQAPAARVKLAAAMAAQTVLLAALRLQILVLAAAAAATLARVLRLATAAQALSSSRFLTMWVLSSHLV